MRRLDCDWLQEAEEVRHFHADLRHTVEYSEPKWTDVGEAVTDNIRDWTDGNVSNLCLLYIVVTISLQVVTTFASCAAANTTRKS